VSSEIPPHTIRISARARYPQIRILPPDSIEVVLPAGMPAAAAIALVASKRAWIRRKLAHFAQLRAAHAVPAADGVPTHPEHIHLPAIDRRLRIAYRPAGGRGVRVAHRDDVLTLSGAVDDPTRVRAALKRWLLATARAELPPMLHALADSNGFVFRQATVRFQKSRWGSCSSRRHIVLNARLLCLPAELARHVMLHELAHLRHLNHSRPFWNLLRRLDPNTQHHHVALRAAWLHMPAWLEAG
jgi:predicted metal-dependent hydrolase